MTNEQLVKLEEWRLTLIETKEAKLIIEKELRLRKQVFDLFFPEPREGTNKLDLSQGWVLKGTYKLDRKIDEAVLSAVQKELRESAINPDILVNWKPELKTAVYKELTAEHRKIFDQALIVKPGSPTMELVPPKEKKR